MTFAVLLPNSRQAAVQHRQWAWNLESHWNRWCGAPRNHWNLGIYGAKVVRLPLVLVISIPLPLVLVLVAPLPRNLWLAAPSLLPLPRGKVVRRPLVLVILILLVVMVRGASLGGGGVPQAQAQRRS